MAHFFSRNITLLGDSMNNILTYTIGTIMIILFFTVTITWSYQHAADNRKHYIDHKINSLNSGLGG